MRLALLVGAACLVLLCGCTTVAPAPGAPAAATASQPSLATVAAAASATPIATPNGDADCAIPTTPVGAEMLRAVPTSLLLRQSSGCPRPNDGFVLQAIDPATGAALRTSPALPLAGPSSEAISPDGRTLVVLNSGLLYALSIGAPFASAAIAEFQDQPLPSFLGFPQWTADGSRLVVFDGAGFWLIDLSAQQVRRIAPWSGTVWVPPVLAPDGRTLYVLTQHATGSWPPVSGDPYVAALDIASGTVRASQPLAGLKLGALWGASEKDGYDTLNLPALAIAPDGSRLYVAAADTDTLTAIDAASLTTVRSVSFARRLSLPAKIASAIFGSFVTPVEAKDAATTTRRLAVSPDGGTLYLTGTADSGVGRAPNQRRPLGLVEINAQTLAVLHRDPSFDHVLLINGGTQLLATGWSGEYVASGSSYTNVIAGATGLELLDARSLAVLAHLLPGTTFNWLAVSGDGRYADLLGQFPDNTPATPAMPCAQWCWQLSAIDLQADRVTGQRDLFTASVSLIAPVTRYLAD